MQNCGTQIVYVHFVGNGKVAVFVGCTEDHTCLDPTPRQPHREAERIVTRPISFDVYVKEIGRDHDPFGFTMWLAGGGVKAGMIFGATDEYGYFAIENKVHVHDLHATILHLLGLDHTKLTYPFSGRNMRLTDVHGRVVREILA